MLLRKESQGHFTVVSVQLGKRGQEKEEKSPAARLGKKIERGPSSGLEKVVPNTTESSSHQKPLVKVKAKARWGVGGGGEDGGFQKETVILKGAMGYLGYNGLS